MQFQRIAKRDKKAFLSDQCKEIEENKRMGKTRDLLKTSYQGNISCKDGYNKGQKWYGPNRSIIPNKGPLGGDKVMRADSSEIGLVPL